MTKEVYYKKVGRKYVPVSEYDSNLMDALPKGTHIIMSYPGGQSTRYNIDPAYAPMIAAGRVAEDAISRTIMEQSQMRPNRTRQLTPEQHEAWNALSKALGDDKYALEYCSYREAAEAGIKAMQEEVDKLLTVPAVKKAYEHFLLVCKLTKETYE